MTRTRLLEFSTREEEIYFSNNDPLEEDMVSLLSAPNQDNTGNESGEEVHVVASSSSSSSMLSRPLWWLYFIHGGFTPALPTMALLYLMNTYIQMPLSLLPTYGALAFLPYSLKPLYATLSVLPWNNDNNCFCCRFLHRQRQQSSSSSLQNGQRRYLGNEEDGSTSQFLLTILLVSSSSLFFATAFIPQHHGSCWFLVLGFCRGVCMAWPEFLLELFLLDHCCRCCGCGSNDEEEYKIAAARLQAQAATARNIGSILAFLVGWIILLVMGRFQDPTNPSSGTTTSSSSSSLNRQTAMCLLFLTSLSSLVAALISCFYHVGIHPTLVTTTTTTTTTISTDVAVGCISEQRDDDLVGTSTNLETDFLLSGNMGYQQVFPLNVSPQEQGQNNCSGLSPQQQEDNLSSSNPLSSSSSFGRQSVLIILLLQVVVILFTLRQSIFQPLGDQAKLWVSYLILVSFLLFAFGWFYYYFCCKRSSDSDDSSSSSSFAWNTRNRVGIFLILRNMVPDVGFLLESFRYSVFAQNPTWLQFLSLLEMAVIALASWTFGRWFSPYLSDTDRVKRVLIAMTILASLTSLSQLWFVHLYRNAEAGSYSWMQQVSIAVLTGSLTTWMGEWNFLPDVILATSVAVKPTEQVITRQGNNYNNNKDEEKMQQQLQQRQNRSLQYGTLITCIDFGDQLGAVVTGTLVSALGVTRENDWDHLEYCIRLFALLGIISTIFVMLLR